MDPLSISASIAALLALTGTVVHYLKAVKGASNDSQKILLEVSSVSDLLYQLKEGTEEEELSFNTVRSLCVREGPLEQFKASLEILVSKLKPVAGWRKAGKALTWPFRREEINDILGKIERQKALFGLALENDHIALSQAIKHHVTDIQAVVNNTQVGVTDIQAGVAELQVARKDLDEENILRWLATTDPSMNHNAARTKHEPTTGDWFIRSENFNSWWNKPSQTLWLYGIPGSGKTVLLSTAANHVKDLCSNISDVGYAYFYFTFRDELKQTTEGFLLSIIVQLSSQRPSLPEEVRDLYNVYGKQQQRPPLPNLIRVFRFLLQSFQRTYLMFDALDECSEQEAMLDLLTQIPSADQHSGKTSVLITSRRERAIVITLQGIVTDSVCIQSKLIEADIRLHVRSRLSHDRELKRHSGSIKQEIEEALVNGADGMFRWVDCQLEALKKSLSPASIRRALKSLPKTLDETYDRILGSIEEDYREAAHMALQWLAFSARPLRLEEIVEVVAVVLGGSTGFEDDRLSNPHDVLAICSSLVTIGRFSSNELSGDIPVWLRLPVSDEKRTFIYLAHYSVKEYLTSDRILAGSASAFAILEIPANKNITELCLTYLSIPEPGSLTRESLETFPLLNYAAQFWHEHAHTANEELGLDTTIVKFLKEPKCLTILHVLTVDVLNDPSFDEGSPNEGSPCYYASYRGLLRSAAMLVEEGADVNSQGGYYGNALLAAAKAKHLKVVKLLLEAGADVNAQGECWGNALQAAATKGKVEVMKLLLEAGADVNAQGGHYGNALQAAATTSNIEVMKLLLERGADVNAQGGWFGNALQAAAKVKHVKVVKLLLEAGADVNAQGGHYGNALQAAATPHKNEVIKPLLETYADVYAQAEQYGNALQAEATTWKMEVMKLLLEAGANVNAQGGYFGNALQAAAVSAGVEVMRLLLQAGAEVNAHGGSFETSLRAAVVHSEDSTKIKLLLETGADVNAQGGYCGNAVQAAACHGRKEHFRLLLEHGAVITQDGDFDNPWDLTHYGAQVARKMATELQETGLM